MTSSNGGQSTLVYSLATLLRNDGDSVLDGTSTLTLQASSLQHLTRLFELHLLTRTHQHGFLALPSHPADTPSLLQVQFLFDMLQKTVSLKIINPPGSRLQSVVKIFPFKSLKYLELKRVPPHCLEGLRGVYSQLEGLTCSKSLSSLEELLSLCGGDLSSALPWLELHTLNFSYNSLVCLDESLSLLNMLKSLDLSHNKIEDCAEFLKPLSELELLNLGYNHLQRAPELGVGARAKLVTLILRNNELENVNGVEQCSALRHLDVAYNLLTEHSQLAPLSLLHCLSTLNLQGNPLFFQRTHRACTVRHLSPKAAFLRLRLDGCLLSSSELAILPKPGQMIGKVAAPVAVLTDRGSQDVSSGCGELSDSLPASEAGKTALRRRKSRNKVRVRRASISEPSDTDYEPKGPSLVQDVVLPHQKEIERMDSFREQLGEEWLRYQHHLDGTPAAPALERGTPDDPQSAPCAPPPAAQPQLIHPPLLTSEPKEGSSEPDCEASLDVETESTLQWACGSQENTESTLENGLDQGQGDGSSITGAQEEEEEDHGVDLCPPLLVGLLCEEDQGLRKASSPLFLRVKPGYLLEVDMQRGQVLARLDLDSLREVTTSQATWTEKEVERVLPALELYFSYISRDKQRRRYVMLDDDPQQAQQALADVLSRAAEENECRLSAARPRGVRLQCLRCRSEFSPARGAAQRGREQEEESREEGSSVICPECTSDHVVQLPCQSGLITSTPLQGTVRALSEARCFTFDDIDSPAQDHHGNQVPHASARSSPIGNTALQPTPSEDLTDSTVTTKGSTFYIGSSEGDSWVERSFSQAVSQQAQRSERAEELAGSYSYANPVPVEPQLKASSVEEASPALLDLLSEDFEAVDHRLKLYLDMEVFEGEEELRSFLRMSVVKLGDPEQFSSLLVVSDQHIYILEITSDMEGQPSDWLRKRDSHQMVELSYLEVGLGSQSIHMEFAEAGAAYTLLVRDSARCKRFFGLLTGIVREMAPKSESKLKSISTTRLTPQHHLWPLVCDDTQTGDMEDGHLQFFYLLAFVHQGEPTSGDLSFAPMTVLVTRETLYLLIEDHQWSKSCPNDAANENGEPSTGKVTVQEAQPISSVSSLCLLKWDPCRVDIKLYDEMLKVERTWALQAESPELVWGLVEWVRTQWEAMFGVKLTTSVQEPQPSASNTVCQSV